MRIKDLTTSSHATKGAALLLLFLFMLVVDTARAQDGAASSRAAGIQETTLASATTGSITGRVTGEDGRPAADVQVFIFGAFSSTGPRSVVTDASGRFQFKELRPGLYGLRAAAPAYVEMPDENRNPFEPKYFSPGETAQLTLVKGGVITGTVLNAQGEPLVGALVRAIRVRDAQGRRTMTEAVVGGMPRMTDDRGVYRIYGLQAGSYLIIVGGGNAFSFGMPNLYQNETPTYYPSSTRDTAAEVTVRTGEEATGIDVRYRGERGRTVSGVITGAPNPNARFGTSITLTRASTGLFEAQTFAIDMGGGRRVFSLNGVPDGEYEISAQGFLDRGENLWAAPRKITVRGADVTGLQLQLAPLASIAGRVTFEPSKDEACARTDASGAARQTLVSVRRDEQEKDRLQLPPFSSGGSVPNEQGEFSIRNLSGGVFRLSVRAPGEDWYVRSLTLPQTVRAAATPQGRATAPPPGTVSIRTGERITNVLINLAQGAAALRGRVTVPEGAALPANLRVYLVPSERERADDLLRYAEASVGADGSFSFTSLAPGRYWLLLRAQPPASDVLQPPRMLSWDDEGRKTLRREAEAANNAVELKPCQRVSDYTTSYAK